MLIEETKIREKRAQAAQAMQAIVSDAEEADRGLNDEEKTKWDGLATDIKSMDERLEHIRAANELDDILAEPVNPMPVENRNYRDGTGDGSPAEFFPESQRGPNHDTGENDQYAGAFDRFMRNCEPGLTGLSDTDRAVLRKNYVTERAGSNPGSAGGYLIPERMGNRIIETMAVFGGLRQVATVMPTSSGEAIGFPTNDDTTQKAVIVGESQDVGETDITFGQEKIASYKYSTKVLRIPFELLQDSAFPLDRFIARKFGQRLGRGTSEHYAVGTGTGQPTGIATAATVGHTAASATEVTYRDLARLKHSVDPAYRGNAKWVFNDALLLLLKEMEDTQGRPLWKPAIATDAPDLIDGDSFIIDQGIEAPAAGAVAAVYGDISEFVIRDVRGIMMMRLYERYAEFGQVGYLAFFRTDSNLMDKAAVKTLAMAGQRAAAPKSK